MKLTPKASKNSIEGLEKSHDEKSFLKVKVRDIPEKGKANKALCNLISKYIGIPKRDVLIVSGPKSRHKNILIKCQDDLKLKVVNKLEQDFL